MGEFTDVAGAEAWLDERVEGYRKMTASDISAALAASADDSRGASGGARGAWRQDLLPGAASKEGDWQRTSAAAGHPVADGKHPACCRVLPKPVMARIPFVEHI